MEAYPSFSCMNKLIIRVFLLQWIGYYPILGYSKASHQAFLTVCGSPLTLLGGEGNHECNMSHQEVETYMSWPNN